MTNEIKEIIKLGCEEEIEVKYFAKDNSLVNTYMDYSQLLDYITNLQEENERLKLNQTKKVFDTIGGLIKNSETCSYRYLIYDLLGFQEKDYVYLMGGLAITNMLVDYEDYKQRIDKAIKKIEKDAELIDLEDGYNTCMAVIDILRGDE